MKKNTTNKKLFTIVAKLVDVNINKINLNTNSENLDEYDSLAILNLATYFEKILSNFEDIISLSLWSIIVK